MNPKIIIATAAAILSVATLKAQTQEGTDSLTRELQEVVVTANQPATRLAGTTLISTYNRPR